MRIFIVYKAKLSTWFVLLLRCVYWCNCPKTLKSAPKTYFLSSVFKRVFMFFFVRLFVFVLFFYYFYYFILSLKFGLYKSIYYQILTALHFYELRATRAMWHVLTLLGLIRHACWWDDKKWEKNFQILCMLSSHWLRVTSTQPKDRLWRNWSTQVVCTKKS